MKILLAPWVLPITREPIPAGAIVIEDEKIIGVGQQEEMLRQHKGEIEEFPRSVLMPALVNAHVHLELSGFRGQVPGDGSLVSWVERLIQLRKAVGAMHESPRQTEKDIRAGIEEAKNSGTGLIGEVSNSGLSYPLLNQAGLRATFFLEVLSFQEEKAAAAFSAAQKLLNSLPPSPHIIKTLSPHAPYTLSPTLFSLLKNFLVAENLPSSFHLGESSEEVEFLLSGQGPLKDLLDRLEAGEPRWQAPETSPLGYWQSLNPPKNMMLVHLTQFRGLDIKSLGRAGIPLCLCPRSNAHIGVGQPDLEAMLAAGLTPALGTDSLASNEDLNLFSEMAYVRKKFKIPGGSILKMATLGGARALGWGEALGSLETQKQARIIAIKVEGKNPEEELLRGITAQQVRWV